jgi:hypothetical protein
MSETHGETVASITAAFARKLRQLNDRHAKMHMPVLSLQDPRDVLNDIDRLVGHLKFAAAIPLSVETVDALGAKCIALRLALARVEDGDPHSGSDAA